MTLGGILDALLISPLKLLFEIIFQSAYQYFSDPAVCIVILSLIMNLLVLLLYRRADAMQENARDTEARLSRGIKHIKKTFSGNERFMMLQTYYRQNGYSPLNALRGSVSLLLEIPFFMAAYQFLSHLDTLEGASLFAIKDLSLPDGLLTIGGLTLNLLPILMTLINFVSAAIYLKGFPLKTKVQLYALAIFFLIFLYDSPSGLVFYWTLNNVFSLFKNLVYKIAGSIKHKPKERKKPEKTRRRLLQNAEPNRRLFIAAAAFLAVLTGLLIPTNYIAASPQEYVLAGVSFSPLWYVVRSACLAAGVFLIWFGVFYWLASPKGKCVFERMMWVLCGIAITDYMFFGRKLGIVSSVLQYEGTMTFSGTEVTVNTTVLIALAVIMLIALPRLKKLPQNVLLVAAAAMMVMSAINIHTITGSLSGVRPQEGRQGPHFELSREGKNVVVLFLDRAMGEYVPFLVNEKPELKELFDGFTYYSNVISFGGHTNMGAPALMGGYEYTPVEINRRSDMTLVEKHNEALKVMPVLFQNNGFKVTVCDAPYANYQWIPDLSIYDDYPEIDTYITRGYFGSSATTEQVVDLNLRNFFCFAIMKTLPVGIQPDLYDSGHYLASGSAGYGVSQTTSGKSVAKGMYESFLVSYRVLESLSSMTEISDGAGNNFLFLYNDAPHEPMLMQEPEYTPSEIVDNTEFDAQNKSRFTLDGKTLKVSTAEQMAHYQTNMAVLLKIGSWLDFLRESGVYDNTRIIIVADHGYYLYQISELYYNTGAGSQDIGSYFPLLMVKDFGSKGFTTSGEFMTNADVPAIAVEGLIKDPKNPFTGKLIDSSEKTAHSQFILTSREWSVDSNSGSTFNAGSWAVVTDNIWNRMDWEFINSKVVLTEHKIPEGVR